MLKEKTTVTRRLNMRKKIKIRFKRQFIYMPDFVVELYGNLLLNSLKRGLSWFEKDDFVCSLIDSCLIHLKCAIWFAAKHRNPSNFSKKKKNLHSYTTTTPNFLFFFLMSE